MSNDPTGLPALADLPLLHTQAPSAPVHQPAPAEQGVTSSGARRPSGSVFDKLTRRRPAPVPVAPEPPEQGEPPRLAELPAAAEQELAATSIDSGFWLDVNALRKTVSERLATILADRPELDAGAREELGRELIQRSVQDHSNTLLEHGQPGLSDTRRSRLARALFDAMFRLGRLQPLVDREDVENIEIYGYDQVLLELVDGTFERANPVAESDRDLVDFLKFLAARDPDNEQAFSRSNYKLELPLPGRARLSAFNWVVPRPRVNIRLQRLKRVDLGMLREAKEIDYVLEQFLAAAVRARKTIVVSGKGQGSGKTTLLRALCAAMDPNESVATIETDYELYLHDDPERHRRVTPFQARTGSGEVTASGDRAGRVTTGMLMQDALRANARRVIVGEVRGPEIVTMFEAMQAGNGSMSTVHADSARDVVERLAGLAARDATLSENYAYRQIAQTIDLIVFIARDERPDGSSYRYITEIIECRKGEAGNLVSVNEIFVPDAQGRAVPKHAPTFIDELTKAGFDRSLLTHPGGLWDQEVR